MPVEPCAYRAAPPARPARAGGRRLSARAYSKCWRPALRSSYDRRMRFRLLIPACIAAALVAVLFAQSGARGISLIVTNGIVVTMNPERRIVQNGAVAIDGTDIVAVGTAADIEARFRARETLNAAGQI